MADASQCPFCELRFTARWELKLHLDAEHPGRITDKDTGEVLVEDNDPNDPRPM